MTAEQVVQLIDADSAFVADADALTSCFLYPGEYSTPFDRRLHLDVTGNHLPSKEHKRNDKNENFLNRYDKLVIHDGQAVQNHPLHRNREVARSAENDSVLVVAVLGPQSSGKSTLCNALFGTYFPVACRGKVATATTRGVAAAVCSPQYQRRPLSELHESELHPTTFGYVTKSGGLLDSTVEHRKQPQPCRRTNNAVILDVEGADARERGRSGKAFQTRASAFVASLADVILLNLWYHDVARVDSAGYALLRTVLSTCAKLLTDSAAAGNRTWPRTAIVFVVRDVEDDASSHRHLKDMLHGDVADMWADIALEAGLPPGSSSLEDVIDLRLLLLPHIRHCATDFEQRVSSFREALLGEILSPAYSKNIPADDFIVYASSVWESLGYTVGRKGRALVDFGDSNAISANCGSCGASHADFYAGDDLVIIAAYRCDDLFSSLLAEAGGEIGELNDAIVNGTEVQHFGTVCDDLINHFLQRYETEAAEFADEEVFDRKRLELEAILDTGLHAVFLRHIQRVRDEIILSFKRSIEGDVPEDYAIFTADAKFLREVKECQRPSSPHWTCDSERNDLQRILSEIASQHRKLTRTQLVASQQQSQALRLLHMQQAQLQDMQQRTHGGPAGRWNFGAAYRPPNTNLNVSLARQRGRTNLQVSLIPDESASLLGPNGFTEGVLPGNIGLSFSLNL